MRLSHGHFHWRIGWEKFWFLKIKKFRTLSEHHFASPAVTIKSQPQVALAVIEDQNSVECCNWMLQLKNPEKKQKWVKKFKNDGSEEAFSSDWPNGLVKIESEFRHRSIFWKSLGSLLEVFWKSKWKWTVRNWLERAKVFSISQTDLVARYFSSTDSDVLACVSVVMCFNVWGCMRLYMALCGQYCGQYRGIPAAAIRAYGGICQNK